jgi:hypothetical protein
MSSSLLKSDTQGVSGEDRMPERRRQAEAMIEALNARDFEAVAEFPLHPALEFHSRLSKAEGGVYLGLDGIREWARNIDETFEGFQIELTEFEEVDEDRALLILRNIGTARGSGAPLDEPSAAVWTWRGGRMWRNEVFSNRAEALESLGSTP